MKAAALIIVSAVLIASCGGSSTPSPLATALDNDPENPCLSNYYQTIRGRYSGSVTLDAFDRVNVGPWQSCTWSVAIALEVAETALGKCEITASFESRVTSQSYFWPADLDYAHECKTEHFSEARVSEPNGFETSIAVLDQIPFPQTINPLTPVLPARRGPYSTGVGGGVGTVDYIYLFSGPSRRFNSHTIYANGEYVIGGLPPGMYGPIEYRTLYKE